MRAAIMGRLAPMTLEELTRRVAVTLGALLVYRLGVHVPLPGIDPSVWTAIFRARAGSAAGPFALLAGGGARFGILALDIMPYISAAIILQVAAIVSRRVRALKNQGERGRRIINRRTLYLTALLAALQAYGIAGALAGVPNVVANPGWPFVISTVATLTGGTLFLAWLCEQITLRGIGNGIALILLTGIVAELPRATAGTLELGRQGALSNNLLIALTAMIVAATGFIVLMERARRRLAIHYPGRQVGDRTIAGRSSYLPVKLNAAGVVPVVLASWLMVVLTAVATMAAGQGPGWPTSIAAQLQHGRPLSMILNAVFIVLCVYFYTAFVLDPDETAENLKKHGGSIAAIEPGAATAEHVDYVVSRTTAIGAAYLALVCLIPDMLIYFAAVPFYFGGPSLLIVVCAILDLDLQVRGERTRT
jgi:preprotein translocase subunit SecY